MASEKGGFFSYFFKKRSVALPKPELTAEEGDVEDLIDAREYQRELEARRDALRESRLFEGGDPRDLSLAITEGAKSILSGDFLAELDSRVPQLPDPLEAVEGVADFVFGQVQTAFNQAADNIRERATSRFHKGEPQDLPIAAEDPAPNRHLPRNPAKPGKKSLDLDLA